MNIFRVLYVKVYSHSMVDGGLQFFTVISRFSALVNVNFFKEIVTD